MPRTPRNVWEALAGPVQNFASMYPQHVQQQKENKMRQDEMEVRKQLAESIMNQRTWGQGFQERGFGEGVRQFDVGQEFREKGFGEDVRQFDLGHGLKQDQFTEQGRQFDVAHTLRTELGRAGIELDEGELGLRELQADRGYELSKQSMYLDPYLSSLQQRNEEGYVTGSRPPEAQDIGDWRMVADIMDALMSGGGGDTLGFGGGGAGGGGLNAGLSADPGAPGFQSRGNEIAKGGRRMSLPEESPYTVTPELEQWGRTRYGNRWNGLSPSDKIELYQGFAGQ